MFGKPFLHMKWYHDTFLLHVHSSLKMCRGTTSFPPQLVEIVFESVPGGAENIFILEILPQRCVKELEEVPTSPTVGSGRWANSITLGALATLLVGIVQRSLQRHVKLLA